jgi:hypothetical protein
MALLILYSIVINTMEWTLMSIIFRVESEHGKSMCTLPFGGKDPQIKVKSC